MATELEELLGFLSSPSPPGNLMQSFSLFGEVYMIKHNDKKAAVSIVRDYTGSEDGLRSLGKYSTVAVPSLSRLLAEKKEVSEPAAEALVNLSQNRDLAGKMVEMGMIKTIMDILYKQDCDITHLLVMLLVNLTQLDVGIESLLQNGDEKMRGLYIMKLVRSFCASSSERKGDPFEHVASILVNISQKEAGRKLLLDPKRGLLRQIIRQFDSPSSLRKKGVSGTIRNCCFEAEDQLQNLLLISEFLWPALLLPVAGNKIYSELDTSKMPLELGSALSIERETVSDPAIRIQALDAIYLLVLQEAGRRALWSVNGPRILQVGYEDEENPQVMEAYERVGSLLIQEGGASEASTQES
ncbi:UNVERIFIED_CONTAM: protein HGH1 [Sesamum radiatum]|uniref:Protein HGH1 homolog n=1 Tax=Sesamum radiatum TaxID=300843 RepID=A0AAW2JQX9_SESRA